MILELRHSLVRMNHHHEFCIRYRCENLFMIELEANVKCGSGRACFKIRKENPGIYLADLSHFEGAQKELPPKQITLIRGMRHWTGSCDNEVLLNQLGKIIENFLAQSSLDEESENIFEQA